MHPLECTLVFINTFDLTWEIRRMQAMNEIQPGFETRQISSTLLAIIAKYGFAIT